MAGYTVKLKERLADERKQISEKNGANGSYTRSARAEFSIRNRSSIKVLL